MSKKKRIILTVAIATAVLIAGVVVLVICLNGGFDSLSVGGADTIQATDDIVMVKETENCDDCYYHSVKIIMGDGTVYSYSQSFSLDDTGSDYFGYAQNGLTYDSCKSAISDGIAEKTDEVYDQGKINKMLKVISKVDLSGLGEPKSEQVAYDAGSIDYYLNQNGELYRIYGDGVYRETYNNRLVSKLVKEIKE